MRYYDSIYFSSEYRYFSFFTRFYPMRFAAGQLLSNNLWWIVDFIPCVVCTNILIYIVWTVSVVTDSLFFNAFKLTWSVLPSFHELFRRISSLLLFSYTAFIIMFLAADENFSMKYCHYSSKTYSQLYFFLSKNHDRCNVWHCKYWDKNLLCNKINI